MFWPLSATVVLAVLWVLVVAASTAVYLLVRTVRWQRAQIAALADRGVQLFDTGARNREYALAWECLAFISAALQDYLNALVAISKLPQGVLDRIAPWQPAPDATVATDDAGNTLAGGVGGLRLPAASVLRLNKAEADIVDALRAIVARGESRSAIIYSLRKVLEQKRAQLVHPLLPGLFDGVFGRLSQKISEIPRPAK